MPADFSLTWALAWLVVTVCCFCMPMWPALKELRSPNDAFPLRIHSDHTGTVDFRAWELMAELPDLEHLGERTDLLPLDNEWQRLLQAKPSLEVKTRKPLSVAAPVITSLISTSDVQIEESVRIRKLLQGRNVHCFAGAKMGLFTSASDVLLLESGVNFTKMAASHIVTIPKGSIGCCSQEPKVIAVPKITRLHLRRLGDVRLTAGTHVNDSLVIRGNLTTGENVVIDGNVKVYGDVRLGRGTVLTGSLFVQGDVVCLSSVLVGGPLSATGLIRLGYGSQVGTPKSLSSVMGQRIQLDLMVQVFGSISSVARGTVLKGV